jgi:hypothetical protein
VVKKWTFVNTGQQFIPKQSSLIPTSETNGIKFDCKPLHNNVDAGAHFEIEVSFTAPSECRHYIIEF